MMAQKRKPRLTRTKFPVRRGDHLSALLDVMEDLARRQGPISDYVARLIHDARFHCNVSEASKWQREEDLERFAGYLGRISHSLEFEQAQRLGMKWDEWLAAGRPTKRETTRVPDDAVR